MIVSVVSYHDDDDDDHDDDDDDDGGDDAESSVGCFSTPNLYRICLVLNRTCGSPRVPPEIIASMSLFAARHWKKSWDFDGQKKLRPVKLSMSRIYTFLLFEIESRGNMKRLYV